MNYWPGTNIPKSQGNVFTTWKNKTSLANNLKWKQSVIGQKNAKQSDKNQLVLKKSK